MAKLMEEVEHEVRERVERVFTALEPDLDLVDAMPIEDVRASLRRRDAEGFRRWLQPKLAAPAGNLLDGMALLFWEPTYAGQQVVAADIPKQEHSFRTEYGKIDIECSWDRAHDDEPAYIWVAWRADISAGTELRMYFVNPDTRQVHYEANLGAIRVGEQSFSSRKLGFDPSTERWAIAVAQGSVET